MNLGSVNKKEINNLTIYVCYYIVRHLKPCYIMSTIYLFFGLQYMEIEKKIYIYI